MTAPIHQKTKWLPSNRLRGKVTAVAFIAFTIGLMVASRSLGLDWNTISLRPVALITLLGALHLALASSSLQLTARTVGRQIGFRTGIAVSAMSNLAELLPLPGGAMVRGAALMRAGARLYESTSAVTVTALLTLSLTISAAGIPLIMAAPVLGYPVFTVGIVCTLGSAIWIARSATVFIIMAMITVRICAVFLSVARITAACAVIGIIVSPIDAAIFVGSAALGASLSIIPAGLGVSESIAAALAPLIDIRPSAAFLAVALNRIVGLALSGAIALAFSLMRPPISTGPTS